MQTEGYEGSQLLRAGVGGTKRVAVGSIGWVAVGGMARVAVGGMARVAVGGAERVAVGGESDSQPIIAIRIAIRIRIADTGISRIDSPTVHGENAVIILLA